MEDSETLLQKIIDVGYFYEASNEPARGWDGYAGPNDSGVWVHQNSCFVEQYLYLVE